MKSTITLLMCLLTLGWTSVANAATISIQVDQDVSLKDLEPNTNFNGCCNQFLLVGDNTLTVDYQGMFGFDVSALTNLLSPGDTLIINSMTFNAFNNFNRGDGDVNISLGNTDVWDATTANFTNFGDQHGATITSVNIPGGPGQTGVWYNWNVTSVGAAPLLDAYLTFFLSITPDGTTNFHDFEREDWGGENPAYLEIDYTIQQVPEPSSMLLMGIGALGLIGYRRWSAVSKA